MNKGKTLLRLSFQERLVLVDQIRGLLRQHGEWAANPPTKLQFWELLQTALRGVGFEELGRLKWSHVAGAIKDMGTKVPFRQTQEARATTPAETRRLVVQKGTLDSVDQRLARLEETQQYLVRLVGSLLKELSSPPNTQTYANSAHAEKKAAPVQM